MRHHTSWMHPEDFLQEGVDLTEGTDDYSNMQNHEQNGQPLPSCDGFCLLGAHAGAVHACTLGSE